MALTRSDKEDIQQMHDVTINHIKEILTITTNNLKEDLVTIKEQTNKTNERVTTLEKNLPHTTANCPHTAIISELRDDSIVSKGIKRWQIALIAIVGAVLGSAASLAAFITFLKNYIP